jgi:hypothetical protein
MLGQELLRIRKLSLIGMSSDSSNLPQDSDRLNMDRLSKELRTSIVETLGSPVVPLFLGRNDDAGTGIVWDFAGSGFLVEVDGVSGILTAEHVIFHQDRFKKARVLSTIPRFKSVDSIADPFVTTQPSATHIRIDLLDWYPPTPHTENYKEEGAEWGPDLGFIRIPKGTNFEGNLRATRNFYSWAREPALSIQKAIDALNTIVAIVGAPGEWIDDDPSPRPGQIGRRSKVGVLVTAQKRYWADHNGYDFIDALAAREPETFIPDSFAGVSGGALWLFRDVFHTAQSIRELKREDYVLAGIPFWEDATDPNAPFVRAHGPRSIYEKFLPEVRAWLKGAPPIEP